MSATLLLDTNQELNGYFFSLVDTLSALAKLTETRSTEVTEDMLVNNAAETLVNHFDSQRCSVFLVRGGRLECAAGRGRDEREDHRISWKPRSFQLGEGIVGQAAETGELVHCPDCLADDRFVPHSEITQHLQMGGSAIAVPLVTRGEVLGVVNVFHPRRGHFDVLHENAISLFADVLAQNLDNFRLYSRLEDAVRERTQKLEEALAEAEHLKLRYEQLSLVDELTGLYNRRFFLPQAETVAARCTRHGHDFSLVVIDVDNMKSVNDKFGYRVGDDMLARLADMLKGLVRTTDLLARMAGEEFVVGLPNTDTEGAKVFAQRVHARLSSITFENDDHNEGLKANLGISSLADHHFDNSRQPVEDLFHMAEQALQFGKAYGPQAVFDYSDTIRLNR